MQRQDEIGIRMALGAQQKAVLWWVIRDVALMLGIGTAEGAATAVALAGDCLTLFRLNLKECGGKPFSVCVVNSPALTATRRLYWETGWRDCGVSTKTTSDRDGKRQICLISPSGGEAVGIDRGGERRRRDGVVSRWHA